MSSQFFPSPDSADEDGLVALSDSLSIERLLDGYRHGIFPWPHFDLPGLVPWCSPDPRAILEFDDLNVSRRLARTMASDKFEVTSDRDFAGVIAGCADSGDRRDHGTWITPEMIAAYTRLHELGHAHSVEVWHLGELAGGIYGVTAGGLFAGESMFYRVRDASKVALVRLAQHLRQRGYMLFDVQVMSPHLARMGATDISRRKYLKRLAAAVDLPVSFGTIA